MNKIKCFTVGFGITLSLITVFYTCFTIAPTLHKKMTLSSQILSLQTQLQHLNNDKQLYISTKKLIRLSPELLRLHMRLTKKYTVDQRIQLLLKRIQSHHMVLSFISKQRDKSHILLRIAVVGPYVSTVSLLNSIVYKPPLLWIQSLTMKASQQPPTLITQLQLEIDHA